MNYRSQYRSALSPMRAALSIGVVLSMVTPVVAQTKSKTTSTITPRGTQEATLKRTTAASFKVETELDRKQIERTQQADAKRDEEIKLLKKIIPTMAEGRKAELIFRLAELYWEKSKFKYTLEFEQFETGLRRVGQSRPGRLSAQG